MQMLRGNAAIANHSRNGRSLLLFAKPRAGLTFEGEIVYETHHYEEAPDGNRDMRQAIVFELRPIENVDEITGGNVEARIDDLAELRKAPTRQLSRHQRDALQNVSVFKRSRALPDYVVARAEGMRRPGAPFPAQTAFPLEPHSTPERWWTRNVCVARPAT